MTKYSGPDAVYTREQNATYQRRFNAKIRRQAIEAYGGVCACCGESEYAFLELDHVNNDGKAHRLEVGYGPRMHRWLKKNGYPPGLLQVLCANCHRVKSTAEFRGEVPDCPCKRR